MTPDEVIYPLFLANMVLLLLLVLRLILETE